MGILFDLFLDEVLFQSATKVVEGIGRTIQNIFSDDGEDGNETLGEWKYKFNTNPDADHVLYKVKRLSKSDAVGEKDGELTALIISRSGTTIAAENFYAPYEEIREVNNKTETFPVDWSSDDEEDHQTIAEWTSSFNDNPDADHVYFTVQHTRGEEDCEIIAKIISKSGEIIAEEVFIGEYEDSKVFHKQELKFPVDWSDSDDESLEEYLKSYADEVNADSVTFSVEHKKGKDDCIVTAKILDEDGNIIDEEAWNASWCKEIKELDGTTEKIEDCIKELEEEISEETSSAPKQDLSVEERLEKLKKLFEDGILNKDEYKKKRKELIALL